MGNWPIAPTMMLGALVAGSTPMGGGVVAFPVVAFWLSDLTQVAAMFSLGIQSFGMTAASIFIFFQSKEHVRWDILKISLPVALGVSFLAYLLKPYYPTENVKLFFSSFWLGCGIILFWVHRKMKDKERVVSELLALDFLFLVLVSILGSLVSDLIGSGADFLLFAFLVLRLGESLKVATFTSVIHMAAVSIMYTLINYNSRSTEDLIQVNGFLVLAIPVVIFFAPFGSWILSKIKESFLRKGIYFLIFFQYVSATLILKLNPSEWIFSLATIVLTVLFFTFFKRSKKDL